jgi:Protein of unknown function (DUF992)
MTSSLLDAPSSNLTERNDMSLKFGACSAFAATLFGLALSTMPAHAYVEVGTLNCRSPGPTGYIVFSTRVFDCVFTPASGARPQNYQGTVQRFGAQIGFTNDAVLGWAVFAATSRPGPGALAGGYVGASGGATLGVGLAANGLVGGLNNSFALQPLSVEGQTGLNVVATVTGLELRPVTPVVRHHRRHRR